MLSMGKHNMQTRRTVYLAGGIHGLSDAESADWRNLVAAALGVRYEILDPLRRDYRGCEGSHASAIVRDDLADISRTDIVLVKADRPSWGTAMEAWFAHSKEKRVIVVSAGPNPSPWLIYCATDLVDTMGQAVAMLLSEAE